MPTVIRIQKSNIWLTRPTPPLISRTTGTLVYFKPQYHNMRIRMLSEKCVQGTYRFHIIVTKIINQDDFFRRKGLSNYGFNCTLNCFGTAKTRNYYADRCTFKFGCTILFPHHNRTQSVGIKSLSL